MICLLRSSAACLAFGISFGVTSVNAVEPLAQAYTEVFHNADRESYVEGPGLVRLDDGVLVAAVPVVRREKWSEERRSQHSVTHLLRSADGGKSWKLTADLPYYSAAPFTDGGTLYLFANKAGLGKKRNADLILLRSSDGGKSWSEPVTLFTGYYWNCHTAMVQRDRKIYWATDDMSFGMNRGPRLVAGDLSTDPMNPKSWRISEPVTFPGAPKEMWNAKFEANPSQYLEPNVIEVNGRLRVLAAVKMKRPSVTNVCAVMDATDDGTELDLRFTRYNSMPGGNLKFCVVRDEPSKLFWATSNLAADGENSLGLADEAEKLGIYRNSGFDRRFLMLHYSLDGLNWFPAGCIAQAARMSQSFMYACPVIDGDDLVLIARSSVHAPNQHDADYATFHRVRDFRKLALNLRPEPEER